MDSQEKKNKGLSEPIQLFIHTLSCLLLNIQTDGAMDSDTRHYDGHEEEIF